ncbi:MAG: GGDEF domain-containing protein, partial [Anaerolineaceae bacterium]|nr:GGDEF domain-containing protein [Anaerolineaceae bacterium]
TVNIFHKKLEVQASYDELTGLYNRRKFMDLFKREIAIARRYDHPLCVLLLDVDHFKEINDTYGHQSGDLVLQRLGQSLIKGVREIDLIGRWGGEEFVILLPRTNCEQALDVAERLREMVADLKIDVHENTVSITISGGISSSESGELEMDEMITKADELMYRAKTEGRNRICI